MTTTINASTSSGLVQTADTSGILQLQTAGTAAVTIDASQNVGIGTASPGYRLQVVNSTSTAIIGIDSANDNSGAGIAFLGSNTTKNWFIGNQYNVSGVLEFTRSTTNGGSTFTTPDMVIDSSGNVGIGTASPSLKLHVVGSNNANNSGIAGGSYGIRFENGVTYSLTGSAISGVDNTFTASFQPLTINGSQLGFAIAGTEKMRIDSSGNLGLGVTPQSWASNARALTIKSGGSGIEGSLANNGANNATSLVFNAYYNAGWKYVWTGGSYQASRYDQEDGLHKWFTAGAGASGAAITFTQAMTLDASGNLLVGTTSTFGTLTVNGNITPVQAPSTAWGIDFAPSASSGSYVTIANNGTYDLAIGSGFIYLYDETAASGVAQIACYYGSTTIVWQNGTYYTIASGTASKINVYYNSGTGKYRIQNTTGASRSMWISTFKMRVSS